MAFPTVTSALLSSVLGPGVRYLVSINGAAAKLTLKRLHQIETTRSLPRSTFAGTSQATPHVAGAAAILFSIRPALSAEQVETLLKKTGKPVIDARNGVTAPRVDVLAAVQELLRPIPPRRRAAQVSQTRP